ncbi:MAG TPA: helix-turn-helix transcriptional regulator [Clostridiales bacterium]|nr:helix-turn-helix transcriptional regulator [Clostridiales bacterium]
MIGNRIKQLRKEYNLTQHQFGNLFGLYDSTICLYESGKRTPEYNIILKIADYFNVSVDWLLGRVDNKNLTMIENDKMPTELRNIGVEYLELAMEMSEQSIPPEDVRKIMDAISALKNSISDDNNSKNSSEA